MDFSLTKEQQMIRKEVRRFAQKEVAPRIEECERNGEYPYDIMSKMAELGLMGIPFPEKYGGMGGDWVGMHLCIEEISRIDASLGGLLDVTTSVVAQEIAVFGTEEQKKKWLVPLAQGKEIGAFGLTEPDSGSDAGALQTTAELKNGEWVLNGTKQFITNIGLDNASMTIVAARVKDGDNADTISTFIVPKDAPGFKLGERYRKIAWHHSATHEVILSNCRVPEENLLGDPNRGFAQHLTVLETGRISIAAMAVGLAQACLDESLKYAQGRHQFGRPIFDFQTIQFKLADMAVAIELARNQYLKAAWLKDQGRSHAFEASAAKLYASEMAEKAASDALSIHGGYGLMEEYPIARYYRGAKILQIVEGTSEIQRLVIGRILKKRK
ncbi:putative acyl-CoA dehydrogenase YngJ [Desulfosarcina alkanivorans]|jgi:alkylation response protein AidB-like acyl-CoA dehydrogenase|uniref:Putative acyl-CoA dehydrogenase YngJ n=1 Tax=Desulfosarcina alkanivorans TaxID=571177 RepID=A0A5K7YNF6_9BACT|nr:acyl-CoA dehydrogenase family protein [Desulfosarcina alkanivorans]BBO69800.1 putative acyl-CoA dehydrogenase YngJ [Desulfosarcina alkanivorans]